MSTHPQESSGSSEPATFFFAPEIELSTVSILWHQPHRLGGFLRDLDPLVHLAQPYLRKIVEALLIAWGELGPDLDWATVVQIIRELGAFEQCGGIQGLDEVYSAAQYGFEDQARSDKIFGHYVQMLRTYAQNREADPPRVPDYFTRGVINLYPNENKKGAGAPDAIGEGKIAGKLYRATASPQSDGTGRKFLKITLVPK